MTGKDHDTDTKDRAEPKPAPATDDPKAYVKAQEAAYDAAAKVADKLLGEGLPLVGFQAFDLGRQVAFVFQIETGGQWSERYVCKLPTELATVEAVRAEYARFAF